MIEWLGNITLWLETILDGISANLWLSVLFTFLVCVGEAVFIAGLLVPSLPILLLLGGIIGEGTLPFWPIYLAAVAGAIVGDAISYLIGWLLKDKVKTVWPFKHHLALIAKGEEFFLVHGGKAIFIGRFLTGIKAVVPGIAGMMNMPYRWFTVINVISAFVWAAAHIVPPMLLGAWLESIGLSIELIIVVGTIVLAALFFLIHYHRRVLLFFSPWLGRFGRSIETRWRKPDLPH